MFPYYVWFEYNEYDESGCFECENEDYVEFATFEEAEDFYLNLPDSVWNQHIGTNLPVHTCAMPPRNSRKPMQFAA